MRRMAPIRTSSIPRCVSPIEQASLLPTHAEHPPGLAVLAVDGPVHGEGRNDGDLSSATARAAASTSRTPPGRFGAACGSRSNGTTNSSTARGVSRCSMPSVRRTSALLPTPGHTASWKANGSVMRWPSSPAVAWGGGCDAQEHLRSRRSLSRSPDLNSTR